jgi:hypothetical protein
MSRLLHAAARGARIEAEWKGVWSGVAGIHFVPEFNYRIHPNDAHLAYGPISTALREMAEDPKHNSSWEQFLANSAANEFTESFYYRLGEPDRWYPLFYLILAEFLADEGM